METEMELNTLCLRDKIFKALWVLGCPIPVQVNDVNKVVLSSFEL